MDRSDDGLLDWLQGWYESHCDGDWEHDKRIEVRTLDNPGWRVSINVAGTALEGRAFDRVESETSETDWIHSWTAGDRFEAAGGARNLTAMIGLFRDWTETAGPPPPGQRRT